MTQAIVAGRGAVAALHRADLILVHLCASSARPLLWRRFAISFSWLGNGLIYPALAASLVLVDGARAVHTIIAAAINLGLLHCLYPAIKRRWARARPYRADPRLTPLLKVLDEHSFPSGHAMTLTAALVPTVLVFPEALPPSLTLWGAMAWARLASAHHYLTDVLAGTALGLLVAYPLSQLSLARLAAVLP